MTDRRPQFGYFPAPEAGAPTALLDTAKRLDELGFDLIGIQDHPYQSRFLDTWTLLSAIAAVTEKITVFPDVACLPLRPPAVLAKSAATLDLLSGGRVELGLGAGIFWDAIEAMGGPRRSPGESVEALREAVTIVRGMWSGKRSITHEGEYYSVKGLHPGPAPVHDIGIWLGAYKPRMLRTVGELGDGWIPSLGYIDDDGLAAANDLIDAGAEKANRDPGSIRRILNVGDISGLDDKVEFFVRYAREFRIDGFLIDCPAIHSELSGFAQNTIPRVRDALG
ncbi:LLM class flavin-dependent oxidoreductase [Rhodococcus rhodnii]|uniref:Coenzyme F420-dependent n=2 Tax=Rhodococcus rhodnii TaxID=38312 RepID=R7WIU6_9NOCA|nr:LLM class flavin-dependent oxidoreductase [Rhodococcus rhodnii]EOM75151.1 coenzyme F420-dependent [Rhodococcus rhodnii LMG 5362]TXG89374.1 LLM class flavin-dependent oxidoreductase [Rhodococcus rhodnii]